MFLVRTYLCLIAVGAAVVVAVVGCSTQNQPQPAAGAATSDDWKEGLSPEAVEAFSQLPDEDRKAALAQRTCPVADSPLGSMGAPYKVNVNGRDVFLCCDGCEEEITSNPDKYLAKLNMEQ